MQPGPPSVRTAPRWRCRSRRTRRRRLQEQVQSGKERWEARGTGKAGQLWAVVEDWKWWATRQAATGTSPNNQPPLLTHGHAGHARCQHRGDAVRHAAPARVAAAHRVRAKGARPQERGSAVERSMGCVVGGRRRSGTAAETRLNLDFPGPPQPPAQSTHLNTTKGRSLVMAAAATKVARAIVMP